MYYGESLAKLDPLPRPILSALLELVKHDDQSIRENISLVLGERKIMTRMVCETLRSILCTGEYSTKVSCMEILASQPSLPTAIIEALVPLLVVNSPNYNVRMLATEALGNQSSLSPEILESVVPLLTDHDGLVRFHVLQVLERHHIFPATNEGILLSCADDDRFNVRVTAARILHHKSSKWVEEPHDLLINDAAMKSYLDRVQEQQVHLSTKETLKIMGLLWDDDRGVREHAAKLIGKQSSLSPISIDAVIELMRAQSDPYEPAYILGMQSLIPSNAVESLRSLLRVPSLQAFHVIMALRGKPKLPPAIFEDLFKLLIDEASQEYEFSDLIEEILREHGQIQSGLHRKYWGLLYEVWQNPSFEDYTAIYLKDDYLYLHKYHGSLKVAFQPRELRVFRQVIRKKQLELDMPDQFLIPESNTNDATQRRKRAQGVWILPVSHANRRSRTGRTGRTRSKRWPSQGQRKARQAYAGP
jgi:hypothetical protein